MKLAILFASYLLLQTPALAHLSQIQLRPSNCLGSACEISVTNVDEGLEFSLSCHIEQKANLVTRFGAAADVTIYRWKLDHFESVDVAKALGTDYGQLFQADGRWFVEAGKLVENGPKEVRYFRYVKGRLVRVDVPPEESARKYF